MTLTWLLSNNSNLSSLPVKRISLSILIPDIKNSVKNIHQYFYCSQECKKLCKYYNRHVDIDNYDLDKLREYSNLVRIETERTVKNHSNKIKNIELRGKKKGYDLDHKYSVVEGFKNNVDPLIISHYKNLEVVTWKENSNKKSKCSLTLKELYTLIDKENKIEWKK